MIADNLNNIGHALAVARACDRALVPARSCGSEGGKRLSDLTHRSKKESQGQSKTVVLRRKVANTDNVAARVYGDLVAHKLPSLITGRS